MSLFQKITAQLAHRRRRQPRTQTVERVRRALKSLPGLEPDRVVLVAGTNGKGSTALALATLLQSAGERVGLFTSPHLQSFTERFKIDGREISEERFCEAFSRALEVSHPDDGCFELLTLMAVILFSSGVDRLVLEAGIGGAHDATNAIPRDTAVITRIGLDHTRHLGSTLKEIGAEKLAIAAGARRCVHLTLPPQVTRPDLEVKWVEAPPFEVRWESGPRFYLKSRWGEGPVAFPGRRGGENLNLALTVFESLGYRPQDHLEALSELTLPGRMEPRTLESRRLYLSGDHNPQGVASLLELLPAYEQEGWVVLAALAPDKPVNEMLEPLHQLCRGRLYLTTTASQSTTLEHYGSWLAHAAGHHSEPESALRLCLQETPAELPILVTGSLHLVGAVRQLSRASQEGC